MRGKVVFELSRSRHRILKKREQVFLTQYKCICREKDAAENQRTSFCFATAFGDSVATRLRVQYIYLGKSRHSLSGEDGDVIFCVGRVGEVVNNLSKIAPRGYSFFLLPAGIRMFLLFSYLSPSSLGGE